MYLFHTYMNRSLINEMGWGEVAFGPSCGGPAG